MGNYAWNSGRTIDQNRLPLNVYGEATNLFNGAAANANYLRTLSREYPGLGSVTEFIPDLYSKILNYNSLQVNVVRRLSHGLQMGMAYTLAKGMGFSGTTLYTDEIGGYDAVLAQILGPTDADRRHNLVVNYSYDIPTFSNLPVIKQLISDWQISGVTKLQSGAAVTPTCSSTNSGIASTLPSLTNGVTASCQLTGQPINLDLSQKDPDSAFQPGSVRDGPAEGHKWRRHLRPRQFRKHRDRWDPPESDLARVGPHPRPPISGFVGRPKVERDPSTASDL